MYVCVILFVLRPHPAMYKGYLKVCIQEFVPGGIWGAYMGVVGIGPVTPAAYKASTLYIVLTLQS